MADSRLKQLLKDSTQGVPEVDIPQTSPSVVGQTNPRFLDFEMLDGSHVAFPYTALLFVSFDPPKGIVALFATHTVRIQGICLKPIYEGLVLEAIGILKAMGDRPRQTTPGLPVVHKITVAQRFGNPDTKDSSLEE